MSFLDRIAECNQFDPRRFVPWQVAGHRVGWLRRDRLPWIRRHAPFLRANGGGLQMEDALADFATRSAAVAALVDEIGRRGEILPPWGEQYPVITGWGAAPLLQIDRAAMPWFGVRSYGIHLNGYVGGDGLPELWIARRAHDKPTYPGQLDNTVAGGQPIGLTLRDNMVKECGEEAAIPAELAERAVFAGAVTYCLETESGLKPDCMFCYDLELPAEFEPRPNDGEVESFHRWPAARVAQIVRGTRQFKYNCNLVLIDFFRRHCLAV